MTSLTNLDRVSTYYSGTIPSEIGLMASLAHLDLRQND